MNEYDIYSDIAKRTDGDVYIGVVGPVRTGKSTFIKRFMDELVIPNISDEHKKERAIDELPQSAGGKTIMTTEPKFVPNEAVDINIGENAHMKVRMIDCVGYMVSGAHGYMENDLPRMVQTPWYEQQIPFTEAAEIGTKKVICDHCSIGLVITSDGTITDIERNEYEEAEKRVIDELKRIGKPFTLLLNSRKPYSEETTALKSELEKKYAVSVTAVNCAELSRSDINKIIQTVLFEFPINEINISVPRWLEGLNETHPLKSSLYSAVLPALDNISTVKDAASLTDRLTQFDFVENINIGDMDLGSGCINLNLHTPDNLFYNTVGELSGLKIDGEEEMIQTICDLAKIKSEYDKISYALDEVKRTGYGIVSPGIDELVLEEPEIVKQGSRYGVKLKASAPSIHMIRADISTQISPVVGSEKQSEELVSYLMSGFDSDPKKIWESNIFGKSLYELVNAGLHNKLSRMPDDARQKLQETLQKIINEGSGGLICIIL